MSNNQNQNTRVDFRALLNTMENDAIFEEIKKDLNSIDKGRQNQAQNAKELVQLFNRYGIFGIDIVIFIEDLNRCLMRGVERNSEEQGS